MTKLCNIEFKDEIQFEFGIDYAFIQGGENDETIIAPIPIPEKLDTFKALYVYSDIGAYQYVGDTYVPLLRVIGVDTNKQYGEYVERIYTQPHYVPVVKKNFDTIEIDIKSDTGEEIQFGIGKIVLKLHFRPKPFY